MSRRKYPLRSSRGPRRAKAAKEQPPQVRMSPLEKCRAVLRDLAPARGRSASMYRFIATMRLMELEGTHSRSEVYILFLSQAARSVVEELVEGGDFIEASHLLHEMGSLTYEDGPPFSVDPESKQILDELSAIIPPHVGSPAA